MVKILSTSKGESWEKGIRYTDEFKQEAVNQVVVHGYPVLDVSKRLGITNKREPSQRMAAVFVANLKKEKIRRQRYRIRADARLEIFEYIELFYNPKRRQTYNGRLAPTVYEQRQLVK